MGLYAERVLPWLVDRVGDTPELSRLRAEVCGDLHGEVLEVGFGSGLNVPHYPAGVTRVVAVEPVRRGVELAAERLDRSGVPVRLVRADGARLPFRSAAFDGALVTMTLCTIGDVAAALGEIRRVLRPGAPFRFLEHGLAESAGTRRWQRRLTPAWKRVAGGCHLDRPVDEIVAAAGFDVDVDRRRVGGPAVFTSMYVGRARPG